MVIHFLTWNECNSQGNFSEKICLRSMLYPNIFLTQLGHTHQTLTVANINSKHKQISAPDKLFIHTT